MVEKIEVGGDNTIAVVVIIDVKLGSILTVSILKMKSNM